MNIADLKLSPRRQRRRAGRGISAGRGKTAGRGTKGQNSRSGGQRNPGFEGGQTPLFQRLPKLKGFRSLRPKLQIVKTSQLANLPAGPVTIKTLLAAKLIRSYKTGVKLLFDTAPKKRYAVSLQAASVQASEALAKAGGSFKSVPLIAAKSDKPAEPVKTSTGRKPKL